MDGRTDTQTDESDFIGRCLTNVERPIGYLTLVIWSKKKTEYDAKISDMKAKQFNTSDYNKFTGKILNKKIKERGQVRKTQYFWVFR